MKTASEILAWASVPANTTAVENLCDSAAAAGGEMTPPTLVEFADRDTESRLLSKLECRPGGLDPRTPSRTREWLWRGLGTLLVVESQPVVGEVSREGIATDDDDEELIPAEDQPTDVLAEESAR